MPQISLRKIKLADKKYFAKWWRDKDLLKLTSGDFRYLSEKKVAKYFQGMYKNKSDLHYMINLGQKIIGNISLEKQRNNCCITQIVIGEKKYWNKGYGTKAIKLLLRKAKNRGIKKVYLEVRPTNKRAIKAYEKCDFKKVRTKRYPNNKFMPKTMAMEFKIEKK